MTKEDKDELSAEEALVRATEAVADGPLAMLGIKISSPEEISVRLAQALMDAPDVDALLADSSASGWGDQEGRSVLVRDVIYAPSTKKSALGFYAIVQAVDVDTNEPLLLTSGGQNVVVQLAKLVKFGKTDVPVKLRADTTADGNPIHRLVKGDVGANAPF